MQYILQVIWWLFSGAQCSQAGVLFFSHFLVNSFLLLYRVLTLLQNTYRCVSFVFFIFFWFMFSSELQPRIHWGTVGETFVERGQSPPESSGEEHIFHCGFLFFFQSLYANFIRSIHSVYFLIKWGLSPPLSLFFSPIYVSFWVAAKGSLRGEKFVGKITAPSWIIRWRTVLFIVCFLGLHVLW